MANAISYSRYSSPPQQAGNSEERQHDAAVEYCRRHGHKLLDIRIDRARSGYYQANLNPGAELAKLRDDVRSGVIPKGTLLLLESYDRFSRAPILNQLELFTEFLKGGISIVNLSTGAVVNEEILAQNPWLIFGSVGDMTRATQESARKVDLASRNWVKKRQAAAQTRLTAACPGWLRPNRRGHFDIIPRRAYWVKKIFEWTLNGEGRRLIANRLNAKGLPVWGVGKRAGKKWHDSYVQKILRNPAVYGLYQPHTLVREMVEGRMLKRRKPVGDPIAGYYPVVVSQKDFDKVQARGRRPTGPVAETASNLFSRIAYDGFSGATMCFLRKGTSKRGGDRWNYLVSTGGIRRSWNYNQFERLFMEFVKEVNWEEVKREVKLATESPEVLQWEELLDQLNQQVENLTTAVRMSSDAGKLPSLVRGLTQAEKEKAEVEEKLAASRSRSKHTESVKKVLDYDRTKREERRRLRDHLRESVERVYLYCTSTPQDIAEIFLAQGVDLKPRTRCFCVKFKNGAERWVLDTMPVLIVNNRNLSEIKRPKGTAGAGQGESKKAVKRRLHKKKPVKNKAVKKKKAAKRASPQKKMRRKRRLI